MLLRVPLLMPVHRPETSGTPVRVPLRPRAPRRRRRSAVTQLVLCRLHHHDLAVQRLRSIAPSMVLVVSIACERERTLFGGHFRFECAVILADIVMLGSLAILPWDHRTPPRDGRPDSEETKRKNNRRKKERNAQSKKNTPRTLATALPSAAEAALVLVLAANPASLQKHPRRCTRRPGVVVEHEHCASGEAHSALCVSSFVVCL